MRIRQLARTALKVAGYVLAAVIPPVAAAALSMQTAMTALMARPQPPATPIDAPRPLHDASKPTVAIIASNDGTEITDLLAPYAVFAAAEAFNVYVVAPERIFTPFLWGGVDILPHYSFAELDALLGRNPDVIVMPFVKNPTDPTIVNWIRRHAGAETTLLSICGGAHVLAATGLADGLAVTTHDNYFPLLAKDYPQIKLVRGVRYTDNGRVITSAGITAGIDASLHTVQKLAGRDAALAAAAALNYPHTGFLTDPAYPLPAGRDRTFAMYANAGFAWPRAEYGVFLFDGVAETDLTALLDVYGRTFTARTVTVAAERRPVVSQHGLILLPRADFANAPRFARLLIPAGPDAVTPAMQTWAQTRQAAAIVPLFPQPAGAARPFAFDAALQDVARQSSRLDALSSAQGLEYPVDAAALAAKPWPLTRLATGLAAALGGLAAVHGVARLLRRRPGATARLAPVAA